MSAAPAQRIGRFEVVRPLGRGSQGSVYQAIDPTLDRHVAIKMLNASNVQLSEIAENGAPLEAVIASKLNHPNVVPIYDAGENAEGQYLIFEYVEGETLSQMLKDNGPFSIEQAVPILDAILDGMAAAHQAGILHLDLSPRNVLVNAEGIPRIMDFGLSQFAGKLQVNSEYATGTLRYMSPEHFLGRPLGAWTDVFALGSTFFELVTGRHAMRGGSIDEVRDNIIRVAVDYSAILEHGNGEAFARFLAGALLPNPQGRYADCVAMRDAFKLFLEEVGLIERLADGGSRHSTIDFLLRRMQRKKDFPTISSTLADINRLTSGESTSSADKLANVILRDLALTSKLLKLVNSAFYGARASEVTSISQAVVFLGVEQVRMTANSLTLFGHLKSDSETLKDAMIRSFLSGLIARHLAQKERLPGVEEAFIAGLCQNLGETLVIYYFADEHDEIESLRNTERLSKQAAARSVLGVSYADLGCTVAQTWSLPGSIVDAIRGLPPGPVRPTHDNDLRIRDVCVFTNELCDVFHSQTVANNRTALNELLEKYSPSVAMGDDYAVTLLNAGFEKLKAYAPLFEVNIDSSAYCRGLAAWLAGQAEAVNDA
ncbi:MAG: HDOD domain-containing protein [Pseudomonadota bacterium]